MHTQLFHTLKGDTIYFKELDVEDTAAIHQFASDPDVSRFIGWDLMLTVDETQAFIKLMQEREDAGTHLYASVIQRDTDRVIGTVMLFNFDKTANQAEAGYVFAKDSWGNGYGTEALSLISHFGFHQLKLHKLHAIVTDANAASARILKKNNFVLEGRLKDHFFIEGAYYDALLYGIIHPNEAHI